MKKPIIPGSPPHLQRRGSRLGVVGSNANIQHHHQRRNYCGSVRKIANKDESMEPKGPMPGYLTRRKPTVTTKCFPSSNDISQTFTLPLEEEDDVGCRDDLSTLISSSSYTAPSCSYSASGGGGRSESESMVSLFEIRFVLICVGKCVVNTVAFTFIIYILGHLLLLEHGFKCYLVIATYILIELFISLRYIISLFPSGFK